MLVGPPESILCMKEEKQANFSKTSLPWPRINLGRMLKYEKWQWIRIYFNSNAKILSRERDFASEQLCWYTSAKWSFWTETSPCTKCHACSIIWCQLAPKGANVFLRQLTLSIGLLANYYPVRLLMRFFIKNHLHIFIYVLSEPYVLPKTSWKPKINLHLGTANAYL